MTNTLEALEQTQFLTFLLADESYAISILRVREIIEYETVTRVPNMPASIRGVINLRGAVVPVVDMGLRFGMREIQVTKRTCVIIVEVEANGERLVMGLMADAVSQVIDLPPADIEPPPAFGTRVRVDFLKGLGKMRAFQRRVARCGRSSGSVSATCRRPSAIRSGRGQLTRYRHSSGAGQKPRSRSRIYFFVCSSSSCCLAQPFCG